MNDLASFLEKLTEYASNNVTAFEGFVQITHNEREDLRLRFARLSEDDQRKALEAMRSKGIDTATWR
jgi:hypothetical protein